MKNIVTAICLISLLISKANAQNMQKEKNDTMKEQVVKFFNEQNADSLYSLAGTAFKKQLRLCYALIEVIAA